jgi:hypothetical protein
MFTPPDGAATAGAAPAQSASADPSANDSASATIVRRGRPAGVITLSCITAA